MEDRRSSSDRRSVDREAQWQEVRDVTAAQSDNINHLAQIVEEQAGLIADRPTKAESNRTLGLVVVGMLAVFVVLLGLVFWRLSEGQAFIRSCIEPTQEGKEPSRCVRISGERQADAISQILDADQDGVRDFVELQEQVAIILEHVGIPNRDETSEEAP